MKTATWLFAVCLFLKTYICIAQNYINTNNVDIRQLINFITSPSMLINSIDSKPIPLSFYVGDAEDVAGYFGDYICIADNTCTVVDVLYSNPLATIGRSLPFAILGRGLPPMEGTELEWFEAQAQIERTNIKYATDIYHGATWQIATALAAANGFISVEEAETLVANQLSAIMNPANRAFELIFQYGYRMSILKPMFAYTFRWITTNLYNKDPFFNGRFQNFISSDFNLTSLAKADPKNRPPSFFAFVTTWSDYKPLTGKNAWAQLIGPLQAEFILTNGNIPLTSLALQNAINSLVAFSLMQSGIGAFYAAPGGTQGLQSPIPRGEISLEDNFAVLAGLQILQNILQNIEQTAQITQALHAINVMLNGGKTVNGFQTLGLLSFLFNGSFDAENGIFFTNGSSLTPTAINDWQPEVNSGASFTAITTNLWAISALGPQTIDNWFGQGTALNIWQMIRNNGGYFKNDELWGVGYSLNNNNMGASREGVMTTAGTAAAINALNSLLIFYNNREIDTTSLAADLASLQANIIHLRNDMYLDANFNDATPREFFIPVPLSIGQAYLYASKRFPTPFDWNGNTIASTHANAWVLMNAFGFNPFQYSGKFMDENYSRPATVNILKVETPEIQRNSLPKTVIAQFSAGDLGEISQLTVKYNLDGTQTNWIIGTITDQREGIVNLPQGTRAIAISFIRDGFANACQIIPATKLCNDNDCMSVKTIIAHWSSNGLGDCDML